MSALKILAMHIFLAATFAGFLAAEIAEGMPDSSSQVAESRFPQLKAFSLAKHEFSLPQDFAGKQNLLLIAFEREQQEQLDTWLKAIKTFEDQYPGFRYYELPTIAKSSAPVRWFIDSGMRRGIPDEKARERTITVYTDKTPFREALNLPDERHVYALLVDRSGRVLWRAEGAFDDAKGAELKNLLQKLQN